MSKKPTASTSRIRNQFGQFAQIPEDLVTDPAMTDRALRIYALLWVYSGKKDRDAFPARQTLADDLGVSKSTVDRGIRELVLRGAITVEERWDGERQTSNLYTIVAPLPTRSDTPEVIHRGVISDTLPSSDMTTPGSSYLTTHEQEPEEQEISGPVPDVTSDRVGTGPRVLPHPPSDTYGKALHPADVFAAVGHALPSTFTDQLLEQLADEIIAHARPSRVFDPTAYVIRTLRNRDGNGKWLLRADDLAAEAAAIAGRAAGF